MPGPGYSPSQFPRNGPPRRKAPHRLILGIGTALVVATGVGVAAAGNLTSHSQPTPSPSGMETGVPSMASPGAPSPGAPGTPSHGMRGPFGTLHGQFVVPKQGGGYQTLTTQVGIVTSIQQGMVGVRSDDGFASTYTIDDNTRICAGRTGLSGVLTGHRVWVIGNGQGNPSTALVLTDLTQPPWPAWAPTPGTGATPTTSPSGYESGTPSPSPTESGMPPASPTGSPPTAPIGSAPAEEPTE